MADQIYKIKKSFRLPFTAAVVLLLVLFIISCVSGETWEKILLGVLFVVTLIIAVEASEREFAAGETGLRIKKFFRTKTFTWTEITHLGVVILRNKAYFLLTTTKGFYIFSNLLQDHTRLIRHLTEKLEAERVEVEVKNYLEAPIERASLMVLTWIAVGIIVAIILTKLIN
ncbi:MAG: hypothetical protein PHG54_00315 [Smithellaceae bacterium]|nr:hypothetical protein [Syntrophaceae bacterium]MDD4239852.1 hypothetical protein [Smithellaceae bacterium]NLX52613.1 hypothetical protein [Deltaproteobacteria bacterium]